MWGMRCEEVWSPQGGREGAIWERRTASSRPEGHTAEVRIRKGTENSPTEMIFVKTFTQDNFEQIWKFTFPHFKKFYSKLALAVVVTNIKSESPGKEEGHQSGRMLPQAWDIQFTKYNRIHAVFLNCHLRCFLLSKKYLFFLQSDIMWKLCICSWNPRFSVSSALVCSFWSALVLNGLHFLSQKCRDASQATVQ